jgi:protein gp37
MGISKISWTHYTFNPWAGCEHVSPACENCCSERQTRQYGYVGWGSNQPRRRGG